VLSPSSTTLPAQDDPSRRRALQPRHERGAALGANNAGWPAKSQLFAQPVPLLRIAEPLLHDPGAAATTAPHRFLVSGVELRLEADPRPALAQRLAASCGSSQFDGGFVVWHEVFRGRGAQLGTRIGPHQAALGAQPKLGAVLLRPDLMRAPDMRCQHSKHAAAHVALSPSGISSKDPELTENCAWPRAQLRQSPARPIASTTCSTPADGARITWMIVARRLGYVSGEVRRQLRVKVVVFHPAWQPLFSDLRHSDCRTSVRENEPGSRTRRGGLCPDDWQARWLW